MYEQVETGPLYDKAVQLMSTYRSVAARMENAKARTKGKLDRRLERLGEKIGEVLGELSDNEMMALDCWQHGFMPDVYEVDHAAITRKPYVSIRKVERWDEEYDIEEERAKTKAASEISAEENERLNRQLQKFLKLRDDEL
jgi:predicted nucleotidyltransferase